jgi:hypothetical protein
MTFANARRSEHGDAWAGEMQRAEPGNEVPDSVEEQPRLAKTRVGTLQQDAIFGLRRCLDRL